MPTATALTTMLLAGLLMAPAATADEAVGQRRWPKVMPQNGTVNEPQTRNQLGFVTVLLSRPSRRRVVATLAVRPGTAGIADFVPLHPIVVFKPGETSQLVSVEVLPDRLVEGPETVRLVVTSVRHARAGRTGIVTIDDADDADD
jgi:hypothetical protein